MAEQLLRRRKRVRELVSIGVLLEEGPAGQGGDSGRSSRRLAIQVIGEESAPKSIFTAVTNAEPSELRSRLQSASGRWQTISYRRPGLEIPVHSIAILRILPAILLLQKFFFTQYLPMEQRHGDDQIDQENPIREHQELTQQDECECHVNRIAAKSKNAGGYEFIRAVGINANTETLPKRDKTQK